MSHYCAEEEQIVMTPTIRSQGHITIKMERLKPKEMEHQNIMHIAGGDHTGIIITQSSAYGHSESAPPELFLGLKVMLKSMSNNRKQQENWMLKFWFKEEVPESERIENAQVFCTELVAFDGFPKDYVDFIKRTLKLMQLKYPSVQKVEVEMKKLDDTKEKRRKEDSKTKKRAIDQNNEENYKTDTMRVRRKAEDLRDMQRVEEISDRSNIDAMRGSKQADGYIEIQKNGDVYVVDKTDTLRARKKREDLRQMQDVDDLRQYDTGDLRQSQKNEDMRQLQKMEELRRLKEMEELKRLKEIEESRRLKEIEELRRLKEMEESRRLMEMEESRRLKEMEESRRLKEMEESRRLKEIEESRRLKEMEDLRQMQKAEDLRQLQKAEELRQIQQLQKAEELKQLQKAEELRQLQQLQKDEELRQLQKAEELRQLQKAEEIRQMQQLQKAEELKQMQQLQKAEELKQMQKAEEQRQLQKVEEQRQLKKAEELKHLQKAGESRELRKAEDLKQLQKAEEFRHMQQLQKAEELRQLKKDEELRQLQKAEELRQLQKAEDARLRQKAPELAERIESDIRENRRRIDISREIPKADDWRDTYKTDTMRAKKKAEEFRERQKIDSIADSNKTDTMKAKKKDVYDSGSGQDPDELKETDTMKARKKFREVKDAPGGSVKKFTYADLTSIEKKLLEVVESVYPNSLSLSTIAKTLDMPEDDEMLQKLTDLQNKGYLKCMKNGNYMRITGIDTEIKMVRQLPMVPPAKQPIIAIITAHFCEKLAVDTMIDEKETFVKFKTEGESQVYTLGKVGAHRVVSTKLPAIGHDRGPMIAAGSVTTRLLGSFGRVEYVFLVGVGGGVAHYTDYTKHVRLGDVVVSTPPDAQRSYIYMYCEPQKDSSESSEDGANCDRLSIKTWGPPCMQLQQITLNQWQQGLGNPRARTWEHFLNQGLKQLQDMESSFCRPSPETDKLYMSLGEELIEFGHPQPAEGSFDPRTPGMPVLHFGAVGSGRVLMQDDTTRLEFADRHGILAFDTEFDAVVESIFGNRKDNYVFIRGISDYKDGTKKKEWQSYAALAAAAVMKAIICNLEPCD